MVVLTLTAKQRQAIQLLAKNEHTDILFDGGVRAGKTFVILIHLINVCLINKGIRILIARSIFAHAIASLWIQSLLPILDTYYKGLYELNLQNHIVRFPSTGAELWLGGLDTKERADKIFGQEYAIIFLNEIVQISEDVKIKIESRLAQKVEGVNNYIIYDCNPRSPSHWVYQRFYAEKSEGFTFLKWTPFDNLDNISPLLMARLEKMPETMRRRFLKGEWCQVFEGIVYKNIFQENILPVDKDWGYYDDLTYGLDYGYYTAVSIWGIKENKAFCIFEKSIINGTTKDVINFLNLHPYLKQYVGYSDHEPDRIQEIQEAGFQIKKAYKEVGAGDSTVNEFELYFDIDCGGTFQSMLNLMYLQDRDGNWTSKHEKVNDHFADDSRYGLHGWHRDNGNRESVIFEF